MGLFNHLFESKEKTVNELVKDDEHRMNLWNEHLVNHELRQKLSKKFNLRTVDLTLQDFGATYVILGQIEDLISSELVNITDEEKTDEEILEDLEKLKDIYEISRIAERIIAVKQKQSEIIELFQEILRVLKIEIHLIGLIKKHPKNVRELLLKLFKLIFLHETRLYRIFKEKYFFEESRKIHESIVKISRAIILEEEVNEEEETEEERNVIAMVEQMNPEQPDNEYRDLGEDIYVDLAERGEDNDKNGESTLKKMEQIERLMNQDEVITGLIKKLKPEYDESLIRVIILAFRSAYLKSYFSEELLF